MLCWLFAFSAAERHLARFAVGSRLSSYRVFSRHGGAASYVR
jgi:hypothetical protein